VRDLKNRLSEYLRLARAGEVVLVTDLGQVVAGLRSPGDALSFLRGLVSTAWPS
jgi:antitoxin (DNA-binding transcriptional repressor) of toxin-antitoxin stability system